jgi:hypothetical protein
MRRSEGKIPLVSDESLSARLVAKKRVYVPMCIGGHYGRSSSCDETVSN